MLSVKQLKLSGLHKELFHEHGTCHILLFLEGDGYIKYNKVELEFSAGVALFLKRAPEETVFAPEAYGKIISFNNIYLEHFLQEYAVARKLNLFEQMYAVKVRDVNRSLVFDRVLLMENELDRGSAFHQLKLLFSLFLYDLVFDHLQLESSMGDIAARFALFSELLEGNFRHERKNGFYADKLNISARKLNSLCRSWYKGKIFEEVLRDRLISEASYLLLTTDMAIKVISIELGFCSQQHFRHYFKKAVGVSPSVFKNENKNSVP